MTYRLLDYVSHLQSISLFRADFPVDFPDSITKTKQLFNFSDVSTVQKSIYKYVANSIRCLTQGYHPFDN